MSEATISQATHLDQGLTQQTRADQNQAARNFLAELTPTSGEHSNLPGAQVEQTPHSYIQPEVLENLAKLHPEKANKYLRTLDHPPKMEIPLAPHTHGDEPKGPRQVFDAKQQLDLPGDLVRSEGEPKSGNAAVDTVYDLTGTVRDFYKVNYGRNSIDNHGMTMVSTVNFTDQPGQPMLNAFWNGQQMAYGTPSEDDPIKTFLLLDIAGHEITHGISQLEANLGGWGQAGALNESNSDVFGEQMKQWKEGLTSDQGRWIGGEGFWKPGEGIRRGLRDLKDPGNAFDAPDIGKDNAPASMSQYEATRQDCGGVHANSQIPTSAFAHFAIELAKEHPDDDNKRFSYKEPGHIWFAARKDAGHNPSFAEMAFHTIDEAKKMGFADDVPVLEKAWKDVGVTPAAQAPDKDTPTPIDQRCSP